MHTLIQDPLGGTLSWSIAWFYFPTALALGALHALEPGHAKALTAAYLIGIKGTKRDAFLLGVSVAVTHSAVVALISLVAIGIGRTAFTQDITKWLQLASGGIVVTLGIWMLAQRLRRARSAHGRHGHSHESHDHNHDGGHADHGDHDHDDAHARAHAALMPDYAKSGQRPTLAQIIAFGATGGMIPCPASITVMLLALSIGKFAEGALAVAGFSIGLAATLVGIGLIVVAGLSRLQNTGRFHWVSARAPVLSAVVVILSGLAALLFTAF